MSGTFTSADEPRDPTDEDDLIDLSSEEIIIPSARKPQRQLQLQLPLPFRKTDHSPPSRFIEHREPVRGSEKGKKHAVAHGLYPEDHEHEVKSYGGMEKGEAAEGGSKAKAGLEDAIKSPESTLPPRVVAKAAAPAKPVVASSPSKMQIVKRPNVVSNILSTNGPTKAKDSIHAEVKDDEASPEDHLAAQVAAKEAAKRAQTVSASSSAPTQRRTQESAREAAEVLAYGSWYD